VMLMRATHAATATVLVSAPLLEGGAAHRLYRRVLWVRPPTSGEVLALALVLPRLNHGVGRAGFLRFARWRGGTTAGSLHD
jgi:hypothetical protein